MTDKEQIIIDGVNVNDCQEYYEGNCETLNWVDFQHRDRTVRCQDTPDCYYKQLVRKTQECDRYRNAIEDIEEIVNIDFSLPCARTDCTYPKPCKDSLTENGTKCMRFALLRIKDIVQKNKEK